MLQRVPKIVSSEVSFIKIICLPDFIAGGSVFKKAFEPYFSPLSKYADYYKAYERSIKQTSSELPPLKVPHLGQFLPLPYRHTLNSFWKVYRSQIKRGSKGIQPNSDELFIFLPLRLQIPIGKTSVNIAQKHQYPSKLYVYLFPFGVCAVNLQVTIDNQPMFFDEFVRTVQNLRRSEVNYSAQFPLKNKNNNFESLADSISEQINNSLFEKPKNIIPFIAPAFVLVFVRQFSKNFFYHHKMPHLGDNRDALAYLLSLGTEGLRMRAKVIRRYLSCRLESSNKNELLFFHPKCMFVHPAFEWLQEREDKARRKAEEEGESEEETKKRIESYKMKSCDCMRDNYQSFLNVIFSVNRFLNDCLIPAKTRSELPPERREEYVKALSRVYPSRDQDSSTKYYYKHAIEKVAEKIGLYSSIEELKKE